MNEPALHLHHVEDPLVKPRLQVLSRRVEHAGDPVHAAPPDVAWEPPLRSRARSLETWNEYMAFASRVVGRFHGQFRLERFDYVHPTRLQIGTPRRLKRVGWT